MKRLFKTVGRDGAAAARAMTLLKIGAGLNAYQEPEALQIDLLKQILEVVRTKRGNSSVWAETGLFGLTFGSLPQRAGI